MEELPRYSGNIVLCIKCGNRGAATEYAYQDPSDEEPSWDECLIRTCDRCSYMWTEATVDSQ